MADFTTDEIVEALRCCGQHDDNECYRCPFGGKYSFNDCAFDLYLKAASVIEELQRRADNGK